MRLAFVLGLMGVAACSGAGLVGGDDAGDPIDGPATRADEPDATSTIPDATLEAATDSPTDSASFDTGSDAAADVVGIPEAGPDADASDDAATDPDTGADADAGDDGAADAAPPPTCTNGTFRCDSYQRQKCVANAWEWQVGDQSCCFDARFTVAGDAVTDSANGAHWYRYGGKSTNSTQADQACSAAVAGGHLPTSAELVAIVIGPPVNNKSVCSPTVDQKAFKTVYSGDTWTSDGCVSLLYGTSKPACTEAQPGFLCIGP